MSNTRLNFQSHELGGLLQTVADNHEEFTVRQRTAMAFKNANLTAEEIMCMPDEEITVAFMRSRGVVAPLLIAGGVRVQNLKSRGATLADILGALQYDTKDVVLSETLAEQFVAAYGADECRGGFLRTPDDAVLLAGSRAAGHFAITTTDLLRACAGQADHCVTVLRLQGATALRGIDASLLRDSGIGARQLASAGHSALDAARELHGSPADVNSVVGFRL